MDITYERSGVIAHAYSIDAQLRCARRLEAQLEDMCGEMPECRLLRDCVDEIRLVEKGMRWRRDFLDDLVYDVQRLNESISDTIAQIPTDLTDSDDKPR